MSALQAAAVGDIFVTVTGSRDVLRAEHFEVMKDGAMLANAGHFDVEIKLSDLRELATESREVLPLVKEYRLSDGRRLNLLAQGRVVNLAAGRGHPAAVMDLSFAAQALSVEYLLARAGELGALVLPVPDAIDSEVARLKLESLGIQIDQPTEDQRAYRAAWERGA
jgi:adenosylhomocysteinase